jgi:hypothetical protein
MPQTQAMASTTATPQLIDVLRVSLFESSDCPHLRSKLASLVRCANTQYEVYAQGALRQMVVVRLFNPSGADEGGSTRGMAALRMELTNGLVYGLHLEGNVGEALSHMQELATCLLFHSYDEKCFSLYEMELALVLRRAGGSACTVRLDRGARGSTMVGISAKLAGKVAREALNRWRVERGLSMIEECPSALRALFAQQLSAQHAGLGMFFGRLAADALASVRERSSADLLAVYNFLAANGGKVSRNRVQALQAMPILFDLLAVPPRDGQCEHSAPVSNVVAAIDGAVPLSLSVAQTFDVPCETVRWLRGRTLPPAWRLNERRLRVLLNVLAWMPPEKRPANTFEFEDMIDVAQALASALQPLRGLSAAKSSLLVPRYSSVLKLWMVQLLRPDCGAARRTLNRLVGRHGSLAYAGDFLAALHRAVVRLAKVEPDVGGMYTLDTCQDLVLEWASTRSLRQMLGSSAQWHAALQVRAAAAPGQSKTEPSSASNRQWPLVLVAPLQLDKLTVVELGDEASLLLEGRAMHHCVGALGGRCLAGDSLIVSIRDAGGQRLSTAELRLAPGTRPVVLGQHCAVNNSTPRADCIEAVNRLVRLLNSTAYLDAVMTRIMFQHVEYLRRGRHDVQGRHGNEFEDAAENAAWTIATGSAPPDQALALAALAGIMLKP